MRFGNTGLFFTLGLGILTAALVAAAQPVESDRLYTNPLSRWSIFYPANWTVDDKDPVFVRIHSSADSALCGVHSHAVPFKTVDEFTDLMLAHSERFFRDSGKTFVILARRRISLRNNIIGNDVLTEIGAGGKSRGIFIIADGHGFYLDCETYVKNWERLEPLYDRIIRSFTLGK